MVAQRVGQAFIFCLVLLLVKARFHDDDGHSFQPGKVNQLKNFNTEELSHQFWITKSRDAIRAKLERPLNTNVAKNIIFFIGDGLSVPTLAAARTFLGQREGATGEERELSFEKFPGVGLSKTYCIDAQVADSACTATAYLVGTKANYGTIGVNGNVPRYDCPASQIAENRLASIAQWALDSGKDSGIVTTTRITHASPAGAYARIADRNWETDYATNLYGGDSSLCPDITQQLIREDPGNKFKVILGGGRRTFRNSTVLDEEGSSGYRADGLDLIQEWQRDKIRKNATYSYVWNREQLLNIDIQSTDYILGLFEANHLMYNYERIEETEPTLAELTETAIKMLSKNENGFFVFIEGGRIDHAHHDNQVQVALDETVELHKAVEKALELTSSDDTLIVVSADHAHVMAFNGYSIRGKDITGPNDELGDDGVPYMTLSYTNGPGFLPHEEVGKRQNPAIMEYTSAFFRYPAEVPLESETHGGDDVAVFAYGPYDHLFSGVYEQSDLPHLMAYAACIGDNLIACNSSAKVFVNIYILFVSLAAAVFYC